MTVNGNAVNISTVGTANQMLFYWAAIGTAAWHPETVAGPGSVRNQGSTIRREQPRPKLRCFPPGSHNLRRSGRRKRHLTDLVGRLGSNQDPARDLARKERTAAWRSRAADHRAAAMTYPGPIPASTPCNCRADQFGCWRRGQFSAVYRYWAAIAMARVPTMRRIRVSGSRDCIRAPV
jgi:hypothetical protein